MFRRNRPPTELLCTLALAAVLPATAAELPARMDIKLHPDGGGDPVRIGYLDLKQSGGGYDYLVSLDSPELEDKFLSMRPFKCLDGPHNMVCHLAYTYEIKRHITSEDLTDLEYDLLFLHKTPSEYGINAWNGLYYKLTLDGNRLDGALHEVDLNILAAPPEDGDLRPIGAADLHEAEEGRHSYPRLVIE